MSRVLVTGATGTVGSLVVRDLLARGVAVRAFARDPDVPGAERAPGDFERPETLRSALAGIEDVFLATPNHPLQAEHEASVIDAAVAAGVRRVVKLSASGAQTGSPVAFWDAHGRSEAHLRASGIEAAILRPTCFMTHLPAAPGASARVAAIDPADVSAVAVALLCDRWQPGVHELTGPEGVGFEPPPEAALADLPEWVAANLGTMFALLRDGAQRQTTGTVEALTGRAPRTFAAFAAVC
jgi:uncharacterized protein YbjT (DUF2867 family)